MLVNVDHVVIFVSDQNVALDFYVSKLGFELRHCSTGAALYWGYHMAVGLKGSRTKLQLALRPPGATFHGSPIMLACEDLLRTHEELLARGVEFRNHPGGGLDYASFLDPDRNELYLSDNNKNWIDEGALQRLMLGIPD
jgi:catechol 2,3-dioxygenase-like lactoylglutathione lyase family enzyme